MLALIYADYLITTPVAFDIFALRLRCHISLTLLMLICAAAALCFELISLADACRRRFVDTLCRRRYDDISFSPSILMLLLLFSFIDYRLRLADGCSMPLMPRCRCHYADYLFTITPLPLRRCQLAFFFSFRLFHADDNIFAFAS